MNIELIEMNRYFFFFFFPGGMSERSGSSPLDLDLLWSPAIVGVDNDSFVALFVTRSPAVVDSSEWKSHSL